MSRFSLPAQPGENFYMGSMGKLIQGLNFQCLEAARYKHLEVASQCRQIAGNIEDII